MQTKNCEYCGEEFTPATSRARFHSDKCRVYFWRREAKKRNEPKSLTFKERYQPEFDRLTQAIDMVLVNREFFGDLPPHYERYDQALTELYKAYFGLIRVSDQYAPYQAD